MKVIATGERVVSSRPKRKPWSQVRRKDMDRSGHKGTGEQLPKSEKRQTNLY